MENMIKRIIDMDRKAQAITEAAQREKLDSEKEIAEKARALKEDYLERARRRIQINSETERTIAEQRWKKREDAYAAQMKRLEETYSLHRAELAKAIVDNVLAD